MKLLMENWNNYLTEQQFRDEFIHYITENNITLTEEQLNEVNWGALAKRFGGMAGLKKAAAKAGGVAALIAALGGGGTAQAQDTGPMDDPFAQFTQEVDAAMMKSMQGGGSSSQLDPNARLYAASLLKQAPDLKGKTLFVDANGLLSVEMDDIITALNAIGIKAIDGDSALPATIPDFVANLYPDVEAINSMIYTPRSEANGEHEAKDGSRFMPDTEVAYTEFIPHNIK
jgi:hypothetical protein